MSGRGVGREEVRERDRQDVEMNREAQRPVPFTYVVYWCSSLLMWM